MNPLHITAFFLFAGSLFNCFLMNKQRKKLDLTKPEDQIKNKQLRVICILIVIMGILSAAAMVFLVPMFVEPQA